MTDTKSTAELAWKRLEDVLVPRLQLTVNERAVYSHLFRHTRLEGRRRFSFSIAWLSRGTRVTPTPVRHALRQLAVKGALRIVERSKAGHVVEVKLPHEIRARDGHISAVLAFDLETADFLQRAALRLALHQRDAGRCFYCFRHLPPRQESLDHVVPRVRLGRNSYRNLVACCLECNSQKGERTAQDHLRRLYRQGRLTSIELAERLRALRALAAGKLKPLLNPTDLDTPSTSRRGHRRGRPPIAAPPTRH
jgi:hypothetical protein